MSSMSRFILLLIISCTPLLAGAVSLATGPQVDVSAPGSPVPNSAACAEGQNWYLQRQSEVEPHVAVNPLDPLNMIASYHQVTLGEQQCLY